MIACKQSYYVWLSWLLRFPPFCLETGDVNISVCLVEPDLVWEDWTVVMTLTLSHSHSPLTAHCSPLTSHRRRQLRPRLTAADWRTEAAGWGPLLYCWDTVSVDLEPHYCPARPESASISGTQSGPHPVIDGSHFPHKKCEKSLIDHELKCPCLRESQASSYLASDPSHH